MYQSILVPLDGSRVAERVLPYLEILAKASHARVHFIRVVPDPGVLGSESAEDQAKAMLDAEAYLEGFATTWTGSLTFCTDVYRGDPVETIAEEARTRKADLIVMATHGRSGIGRVLHGSVADGVVRRTCAPVLLIPAAGEHPWPTDRAAHILVPLDGSSFAEEVLGPTTDLASTLGAKVLLLRVVEPPAYVYAAGYPHNFLEYDLETEVEAARRYLGAVAVELQKAGIAAGTLVTTGRDVAFEILEVVREQQLDAVAMATHGRSGPARAILGSVASAILRRAIVPLLIYRPTAEWTEGHATLPKVEMSTGSRRT